MSVYVNRTKHHSKPVNGRFRSHWSYLWCHLWADTLAELEAFKSANAIGGKIWPPAPDFAHHHLQIVGGTRKMAIRLGAIDTEPAPVVVPKPVKPRVVKPKQGLLPMWNPIGGRI